MEGYSCTTAGGTAVMVDGMNIYVKQLEFLTTEKYSQLLSINKTGCW